jgi:putative sigma-54 modulation protein
MHIQITARRFKVHDTIREHLTTELEKMEKFFDGIISCDVVLFYERPQNSRKHVEMTMKVRGETLFAAADSEDFLKTIDMAVEKLERQLKKYKDKLREKDKKMVREVNAKP